MSLFLVPRSDVSEFRKRYKWLALFALVTFLILAGRLFQLQIVSGEEYAQIAHENVIRRVALATTRGVIRDGEGRILASSRPAYNVYMVPGRVMPSARPQKRRVAYLEPDPFYKIAEMLRLTPEERDRIKERFTEVCKTDDDRSPCWRAVLVREDVARDIVAELRQRKDQIPGTDVVQQPIRYYPYKNLGAHMLGYVAEIDKERLDAFRPEGYENFTTEERAKVNPLGYGLGDTLGATGVERAWESHLRGRRGWEKRIVDAHGRYRNGPETERLIDAPKRQDPIPGRDLRLTVDIELTRAIEKAMRPHLSGAVVVVEVKTGRLLALYSKPDFDPNDLSGGGGRARRRDVMNRLVMDPLRPLLDKTMTGAFQPGSTFKPFSALAALDGSKGPRLDPFNHEQCGGFLTFGKRIFRCTHVHGRVNMHDALAESCNVYFFKLAEAVGIDRIAQVATDYGLGQKTGIGVNPESPGNMPNRSWYTLRYRGQFRIGFTLNTAIGQGATTVTPLSLALAYGALSNGGTVFVPQIVRSLETAEGAVAQEFAPRVRRKVQTPQEDVDRVNTALYDVLNAPKGTAYPVRDPNLEITGKTGTAQTGYVSTSKDDPKQAWYQARDHAWFAAFAPSKSPEIAVVVLVEHGGSGPTQAAPVAVAVVREYERLKAERKAPPSTPVGAP